NKDKIVGKWKVEGGPKMDAEKMSDKMFPYMEFAKDGTFKVGLEVTDPAVKEKMGMFGDAFVFTGKYTVNGDTLEMLPAEGKDKGAPLTKGDNKGKLKFDGNDKLTITGTRADGREIDLTGAAAYSVSEPKVVRVAADGRVFPLANGAAEITATVEGKAVRVPVTVEAMEAPLPINFANHVVPVFTKLG